MISSVSCAGELNSYRRCWFKFFSEASNLAGARSYLLICGCDGYVLRCPFRTSTTSGWVASFSARCPLKQPQTAGTAKACYVCYRPSTTVLATINTVDFIYVCPGHLTDLNFASQVKDETKSQVTSEEIVKVKAEWEEKQRRKKEKEKEAAKAEKEKKDEGKKDGDQENKDKADDKKEDKPSPRVAMPSASATSPPAHERYILHRDFFASMFICFR